MKEIIVGIDLGTTYSVIAWVDPEINRPEVIPNKEGELTTPSVVLVDVTGEHIVGEEALRLQSIGDNEKRTVRMIKRNMGADWICFPGKDYARTPEQISAAIIEKLVNDAEKHLNDKITAAVISVPAYFDNEPRKATLKAAKMAGIEVKQLVDEPVAASFIFGVEKLKDGEKVLVYDLGGGTFDASILEKRGECIEVLRTQGSRQLGGYDWSCELKKLALRKYEEKTAQEYDTDLLQEVFLNQEIEKAKRVLSKLPSVAINIHSCVEVVLDVTREEFENASAYLLKQTITKCEQVLNDASLAWQDLSHVLLVGGSTKMPVISRILENEKYFGKTPVSFGSADLLVAQGAALQARGYIGVEESDKNPDIVYLPNLNPEAVKLGSLLTTAHPFGIVVKKNNKSVVSHIIPAGAKYPLKMARSDYKTPKNSSRFILPVVQGGIDCGSAEACISKATYQFTGMPARDHSSAIEVEFEYDRSQIIHVRALDLESGEKLSCKKLDLAVPKVRAESAMQSVVIALDCSASMRGKEIKQAKKEILKLAKRHLGKGDIEMAIVSFGGVYDIFPASIIQDFTTVPKDIGGSLKTLEADNTTPMEEGLKLSAQLFERRKDGESMLSLVVVSDGAPNAAKKTLVVLDRIREYDLRTFAVAIGPRADREFMSKIGPYVNIENSSGLSEAINTFLILDKDITHMSQYCK